VQSLRNGCAELRSNCTAIAQCPYVMDSSSLMQTQTVLAASLEFNLFSRPSVSKALVLILKLSLKVIDVVPFVAQDSCAL
jgi:hypothetical protein